MKNDDFTHFKRNFITFRKGPFGFGFTLKSVRVYLGEHSDYYTIEHIVTSVVEGRIFAIILSFSYHRKCTFTACLFFVSIIKCFLPFQNCWENKKFLIIWQKPSRYFEFSGSPAYEAGLRAEDLVTEVNGQSVHNLTHPQLMHRLLSYGNELTMRVSFIFRIQQISFWDVLSEKL